MGLFDKFRSDDVGDNPVESAKKQYVSGKLNEEQFESRIERALEAEEKEREAHRKLQGSPTTKVDSGGSIERYEFAGQSATRKELEEVKEIRESGGVISYLVHAKALMQFGTGAEWQTENEDLIEWLDEHLPNYDNFLIEMGEDAIWYPYGIAEIVETQGGGFSHIEMVEPWTMEPVENEFGEVIAWEQEIGRETTTFDPDELATVILNKSSGRDNTGISEVLRSEEEIRGFKENRQTVNKALEFLVPHNHWIVGKESGQVIDDNELRRVRNMVDDMEGDTQFITGPDVEHSEIALQEFDYGGIQERDLREVALALGLPLELANIGSDGLGSGMPADLRLTLFERQARAAQRNLTTQVDEELIKPIIEEYSPYPVEDFEGTRLGDPIAEREDMTLMDMAEYLTANEVREELDKPPIEDDEIADSYQSPAQAEAPEGEEPEDGGGIGGLFRDGRALQEVPDNAVSIDDRSEAPEDANVIQGPRGGLYYVPSGEGDTDSGSIEGIDSSPEFSDDPPDEVDISNVVDETNLTEAGVPDGDTKSDIEIVETEDGDQVFVKEQGIMDFVRDQGFEGTTNDPLASTKMGSAVVRAVGGATTTNWADTDNDIIRSEGLDNPVGAVSNADVDVNEDALADTVAAGMLAGNSDMHAGQFIVDGEGTPTLIDHDHSGRTLEDGGVIDGITAISGPLAVSDIEFEDVWQRAKDQVEAADIEGMVEELESEGLDEHAEALRANAEYIQNNTAEEVA